MSDIFREVEEDVRRERIARLWNAYGAYVIAALVLLFAGIGAWQFWQHRQQQERERVSSALIAAQRISNPQSAASALSDLAKDAPKGYGEIARLAQASAMFAAGQQKEAIDLFRQIATSDSGPVGAAARLRAAWAQADSATRSDLAAWLAPLDQPGSAWRAGAREILAYADYRAMDVKGAQAKYTALAADPEAPESLRARAKAMASFLKNGGTVTYGTVPADAPPAPPAAPPAPPAAPAK